MFAIEARGSRKDSFLNPKLRFVPEFAPSHKYAKGPRQISQIISEENWQHSRKIILLLFHEYKFYEV